MKRKFINFVRFIVDRIVNLFFANFTAVAEQSVVPGIQSDSASDKSQSVSDESSACSSTDLVGSEGGADLLKKYIQQKIIDAHLQLTRGQHDLSVLEQLVRHKVHYVRQVTKMLERVSDSPRYVGIVQSVLGRRSLRVKLGAEVFVLDAEPGLVETVGVNSRVGVEFGNSGGVRAFRKLEDSPDVQLAEALVEGEVATTFDEIGGLAEQIQAVREVVELPILHPELFEAVGISQPKGVLLYGPPGTGKTLLARAVAHHTKCAFFKLSGTDLVQKYIGEGARLVRELFATARRKAPAIIFLDEADSIGGKRCSGSGSSTCEQTMVELLNQVDGFQPSDAIKVILATNRIDTLDPALLRPGRVDRKIFFPAPNSSGRLDILRVHSRKMNLGRCVRLSEIADAMAGASGAELRLLCQEAALSALREGRTFAVQEDFVQRIGKILSGMAANRTRHGVK